MLRKGMLGATVLAACLALGARAGVPAPEVCDHAARQAATATGVPLDLLRAIARVETGRGAGADRQPWPWALNLGGDGRWLPSLAEAQALAEAEIAGGRRNLDLGCFQLNYRWHGEAFPSIAAMLEPQGNALHAARFLLDLHARLGDWAAAAGAYHSSDPDRAAAYRARVESELAALSGAPDLPPMPPPAAPRFNAFPLLVAAPSGARGSLVPQGLPGRGPIWGLP
ncbi:MAG: lytic transglycosylase domain-containing protein [Rhodobacterales bacterium]|nr:lytic transglycosylase domain-containing protein [Rhodobacterales bacterium]